MISSQPHTAEFICTMSWWVKMKRDFRLSHLLNKKKKEIIIITLLFYNMSPEQMKSVHYISVWVTSQTPGTLNACLLQIFRVKRTLYQELRLIPDV